MTVNERIEFLEDKIKVLEARLGTVSLNTESKTIMPISTVGGGIDPNIGRPIDWNNTDKTAVYGTQPAIPTKSYNKHAHSRFSGGALIKDVLEIVEYDWKLITNKHSQEYLEPGSIEIKKEANTSGEQVDKIGLLDLVFNPDKGTWGCPAYEIDVKKCFLVERETTGINKGQIKLDSKGNEMKSALYSDDATKTSVVWDENAQCFRFYAVYAPGE